MRDARWIRVSLAAALGAAAVAVHAAVVLPLSIVDNRPFVDVTINGQGPFAFIVDTGSSQTTVSATTAERLQLPGVGAGTGEGAGEAALAFPVVRVRTLAVGPVSLGALDTPAFDVDVLSRAMGFAHFDGVLGVELFRDRVVTLDVAARTLRIDDPDTFRPPDGAARVPFRLDQNGMPLVEARVQGEAGVFQVDTGDRFSVTLFGAFWRANGLDARLGPLVDAMTGYGSGGPIRARVGRAAAFSIGGVPVASPVTRLSLQQAGAFTRGDRAGSIGMGVLQRFSVSFDYRHHVMWLARRAEAVGRERYDRSGMWLGLTGPDGLGVLDVVADGPAARAGIRVGDRVERVGALTADAASLAAIRALLQTPDLAEVPVVLRRADARTQVRITLRDLIAP
jgi:hypothetical protein